MDLWISAHEVQQLLQIDARDRCGKAHPGAFQAAIDGEAGIYFYSFLPACQKTFASNWH
jgi:hypothetical protein